MSVRSSGDCGETTALRGRFRTVSAANGEKTNFKCVLGMATSMSTDTETEVDVPPTPFPDQIVFLWLALLEGMVAGGLAVFSIALLEGGDIIPNVLREWTVGAGVFAVTVTVMFVLRMRKGGYL